jgi:tetratricopeptide (TPR) repeat protein
MRSILHVFPGSFGPDFLYRITFPSRYLSNKYQDLSIAQIPENHQDTFLLAEQAGLLVLHFPRKREFISIIKRRNILGLKTIVEFSDNFFDLPPWNPSFSAAKLSKEDFLAIIPHADLVTVTSQGLKEVIRHENVKVIPNYLYNLTKIETTKRDGIVWAGSYGHLAEVIAFKETFSEINKIIPMTVVGEPEFKKIVDVNFENYLPYEDYLRNFQRFKLGLVIGLDDQYSRCRSDIKPVEMLSQGLLPVLPNLPQYKAIIDELGLPCYSDKSDLPQLIKTLLKSDYANIVTRGQEWIKLNRLDFSLFEEVYLANLQESSWELDAGFHEISSPFMIDPLSNILNGSYNAQEKLGLLESYLQKYPDSVDALAAIWEIDESRIEDREDSPKFLIVRAKKGDLDAARKLISYPVQTALQGLVFVEDLQTLLDGFEALGEPQALAFKIAEVYRKKGDIDKATEFYSLFIERQEWLKSNANTHPFALDFAHAFLAGLK